MPGPAARACFRLWAGSNELCTAGASRSSRLLAPLRQLGDLRLNRGQATARSSSIVTGTPTLLGGPQYLSRMLPRLDLYVCLRPCKAYPGNPLNFKEGIDLVVF